MMSVAMAGLLPVRLPTSPSLPLSSPSPSRASSFHPSVIAKLATDKSSVPDLGHVGISTQYPVARKEAIVVHAVADVLSSEASVEVKDDEAASSLKLESDLLKKKQKRAELRRKRLVRKRRLRKKGRWPPSKMAKLKNV